MTMVRDLENAVLPQLTPQEIRRYSRHLIMPEVGTAGQQKLKAAQGADGRHRRPRLAARAVPRGRRRRHARPGRVRHRRRVEPPPPAPLRHGRRRAAEDRGGDGAAQRSSTRTSVRSRTRCGSTRRTRSTSSKDYDLVVDGTDNFPTRYLVNDACVLLGQAERLRLDLPLRGPGLGVLGREGAVLPLPLPRAAAARPGAVVRRGRRARRAARDHRLAPGQRGDQADHRQGRAR